MRALAPACPPNDRQSSTTTPSVIGTSKKAPIRRGGAGDGMSKYLQPAPIKRPTTSPMSVATIESPARRRSTRSRALPKIRSRLRIEWAGVRREHVHDDARRNAWREPSRQPYDGNHRRYGPATTPASLMAMAEPDP